RHPAERRDRRAGFLYLVPRRRLLGHPAPERSVLLHHLYQPVRQSEARGLRPESDLRENLPREALLLPAALQAALPESGACRLPPGRVRVRRELLPNREAAASAVQAGLQDESRRGGGARGARGSAGRDRAGGPARVGPTRGLRLPAAV